MSPNSSCLSQYCLPPSPHPTPFPITSVASSPTKHILFCYFFLSLSNPLCISSLVSGMGLAMVCGQPNRMVKSFKKTNASSLIRYLISIVLQVPVVVYVQLSLPMLWLLYGWKMFISCSCSQWTENKRLCGVQLQMGAFMSPSMYGSWIYIEVGQKL